MFIKYDLNNNFLLKQCYTPSCNCFYKTIDLRYGERNTKTQLNAKLIQIKITNYLLIIL